LTHYFLLYLWTHLKILAMNYFFAEFYPTAVSHIAEEL